MDRFLQVVWNIAFDSLTVIFFVLRDDIKYHAKGNQWVGVADATRLISLACRSKSPPQPTQDLAGTFVNHPQPLAWS